MGRTKRRRSAAAPQVKAYDVLERDGHHELVSTRAEVYQHMSAGAVWAREVEAMNWSAAEAEASLEMYRLELGGGDVR